METEAPTAASPLAAAAATAPATPPQTRMAAPRTHHGHPLLLDLQDAHPRTQDAVSPASASGPGKIARSDDHDLQGARADQKTTPASPTPYASGYWKSQKVSGKIIEAKFLDIDKSDGSCDPYCVTRIDNHAGSEFRTQTAYASSSPFWSEDFVFEGVQGFKNIKFVVWNENKEKPENSRPIGKVNFPHNFVKGEEEQWFTLHNAESEVNVRGQVRLRIKHFPPKRRRKVHGFSVRIISARDLYAKDTQRSPNPYAVFHLLPDPDAISTQQTRVQNRTINPTFSETFFFTYNANDVTEKEIHCSIWDHGNASENDSAGFLGQVVVPLLPIIHHQRVERWYSLGCIPLDISANPFDKKILRTRKKSITEEEKRNRPRDLIRSLQRADASTFSPQIRKSHQFSEVGFAFSSCTHCNNVLIGTHLQCTNCSVICHQKCKDALVPMCGGVGAIRLRICVADTIVLPLQLYSSLINLMQENNYYLPMLLGRISQDREEAARSLIRIFDANGTVLRFLKSIVLQELAQAPDSKTLFRANSMASKAVDMYMKYVGLKYLKETLEGPIRDIVTMGVSAELDPLKLERSDKHEKETSGGGHNTKDAKIEKEIQKNAITMIKFNNSILSAIFNNVSSMPAPLCEFFGFLQRTVMKRFPEDPTSRYTATSGFLFLRFFAPAVLGPRLFGLDVGPIAARASRNLVLIAKTLQNLSNLVEFGHKEPYMAAMNPLIQSRMSDMRKYIDAIANTSLQSKTGSEPDLLNSPMPDWYLSIEIKFKESVHVARECAELHTIFLASLDKMTATAEHETALIRSLGETVSLLEEIRKRSEPALIEREAYQLSWQPPSDNVGDENTSDDNTATPLSGTGAGPTNSASMSNTQPPETRHEDDEERKIMRMLTRCSSNSVRTSIGSFRHSTDIRDSMIKGIVKTELAIPAVSIAAVFTSFSPGAHGHSVSPVYNATSATISTPKSANPANGGSPLMAPRDSSAAPPPGSLLRTSIVGYHEGSIPTLGNNGSTAGSGFDPNTKSTDRTDDRGINRSKFASEGNKFGRTGSDASLNTGNAASAGGGVAMGNGNNNSVHGSLTNLANPAVAAVANSGAGTAERTRSKRESMVVRLLGSGMGHFGKHSAENPTSSSAGGDHDGPTDPIGGATGSSNMSGSASGLSTGQTQQEKSGQTSSRLWSRQNLQNSSKTNSAPTTTRRKSNTVSVTTFSSAYPTIAGSPDAGVRLAEISPDSGPDITRSLSEMLNEGNQECGHGDRLARDVSGMELSQTITAPDHESAAGIGMPTSIGLTDLYCDCGATDGGDGGSAMQTSVVDGNNTDESSNAIKQSHSGLSAQSSISSAGDSTEHGTGTAMNNTNDNAIADVSPQINHSSQKSAQSGTTCTKCGRHKLPPLQRPCTHEVRSQSTYTSRQPHVSQIVPSSSASVISSMAGGVSASAGNSSGSSNAPSFLHAVHTIPSTKRDKRHNALFSAVSSITNLVGGGGGGSGSDKNTGVGGATAGAGTSIHASGSRDSVGSMPGTPTMSGKHGRGQWSRRGRESNTSDDASNSSSAANTGSAAYMMINAVTGNQGGSETRRSRSGTMTRREAQNASLMISLTQCARCGQDLQDAVFEADGKRYHPHCLTCTMCDTHLTSSLIVTDGDVVCRDCYLRKNGLVCGKCTKLIYAEYLTVVNRNYHIACRKCDNCSAEFSDSNREYFTLGEQVYCNTHRDTFVHCHVCHQRVDGDVLIYGGGGESNSPQRFYHPAHFCCSGCGKDLASTVYYEMDNRPWCQPCFLDYSDKTLPPLSTTSVSPSSSTIVSPISASVSNQPASNVSFASVTNRGL